MLIYRTPTVTYRRPRRQRSDVVRGAQIVCPYSNATRNNIAVRLSVTPADGGQYVVT